MISEETFQRYGRLVADAADHPTADGWEHVAQALLRIVEQQDAVLDELAERMTALEDERMPKDRGAHPDPEPRGRRRTSAAR